MKSLWRKIGFIVAWSILVLGTAGAIVTAAASYGGFPGFCQIFIPSVFFFIMLMVYLEHTNNIEMRIDQTYRKNNNMTQLPESAYTNLPISSSPAPQYQQPMYQQPMYQQPAAPAPAPVQQAGQPWTCPTCGTSNNPSANFCKGCGNKKG